MTLRQQPRRQSRQSGRDRSEEFASFVVERPRAVMVTPASFLPKSAVPAPKLTRKDRTRQSIRDAARGEECTVRITGACVGGTETTVLSHWPGIDGDRGMGIKALDLCGAFACVGCHDVVDGRRGLPPGASRNSVTHDWLIGHLRTLVRLAQKGIV
jgi:hypothetical protein